MTTITRCHVKLTIFSHVTTKCFWVVFFADFHRITGSIEEMSLIFKELNSLRGNEQFLKL